MPFSASNDYGKVLASGTISMVKTFQLPFARFLHLKLMTVQWLLATSPASFLHLRKPPEPSVPPIKEPPDAPENPDSPVGEPDPDEPAQM